MKFITCTALILTSAALAAAQDKISIPLSSPSQQATVKVHQLYGSITVVAGASGQVVISGADSSGNRGRREDSAPAGMHRIDTAIGGIEAEEDHNTVTISGGSATRNGDLTIQVPANASLHLTSVNGKLIDVTGVTGDLEVESVNGSITLKDVSGAVVAHAQNGNLTVGFSRIAIDKPMSFTAQNGKIDVTLPADTKAKLRMKSLNGAIYSDFDVKTEPDAAKVVVEDSRSQNGKYKISMDRSVYGSINGGGPEFRFDTLNGTILIHKK